MLLTHKSLRANLMSTRRMIFVPVYAVYWCLDTSDSGGLLFLSAMTHFWVKCGNVPCVNANSSSEPVFWVGQCRIKHFLVSAVCGLQGKQSEMAADWKQKCDSQWQLGAHGVPMPDSVDWKSVFEKKPFERNLLQNPSPYGNDVTPVWLAGVASHCIN